METVPDDLIPAALMSRAVTLASEGIDETAWSREDALEVIRLARGAKLGILGGDVWICRGTKWRPVYDNWACNRESGESSDAFSIRSCDKASKYISEYPEPDQDVLAYTLVFAEGKERDR